MNSTHPLVREIAVGANIMQAQKSIQSWYRSHDQANRSPVMLQEKAIDSMKSAVDVLRAKGGPDDLLQYSDFVRSLAMRVARAAKEGDVLGVGGELVSAGEQQVPRAARGPHEVAAPSGLRVVAAAATPADPPGRAARASWVTSLPSARRP